MARCHNLPIAPSPTKFPPVEPRTTGHDNHDQHRQQENEEQQQKKQQPQHKVSYSTSAPPKASFTPLSTINHLKSFPDAEQAKILRALCRRDVILLEKAAHMLKSAFGTSNRRSNPISTSVSVSASSSRRGSTEDPPAAVSSGGEPNRCRSGSRAVPNHNQTSSTLAAATASTTHEKQHAASPPEVPARTSSWASYSSRNSSNGTRRSGSGCSTGPPPSMTSVDEEEERERCWDVKPLVATATTVTPYAIFPEDAKMDHAPEADPETDAEAYVVPTRVEEIEERERAYYDNDLGDSVSTTPPMPRPLPTPVSASATQVRWMGGLVRARSVHHPSTSSSFGTSCATRPPSAHGNRGGGGYVSEGDCVVRGSGGSGKKKTQARKQGRTARANAQRYICGVCEQTFTNQTNSGHSCRYHYGKLDLDTDSETWLDWYEDSHGPLDTFENRARLPDGFRWTCCNRSGSRGGCQRTSHRVDPSLLAR